MDDRNDIWNEASFDDPKDGRLKQDKLMAYLEGKLSVDEQREVELWLNEEGMESDALEGLKNLPVTETKHTVNRLEHDLRKTLKKKRGRRQAKMDIITWVIVLSILLIAVIAYFMIRMSV